MLTKHISPLLVMCAEWCNTP